MLNAQIWGLSLACRFCSAFYECYLAFCQSLLLQLLETCIGGQSLVEGCKGEAHRFLGMSPNLLRGFTSEKPQQLMGRPPNRLCDAISKSHIPLILSRPWFLFSPLLTNSQLCSSGLSTLDRVNKKIGLFGSLRWLKKLGTRSHFPPY